MRSFVYWQIRGNGQRLDDAEELPEKMASWARCPAW
jgi:hypothetical protein